MASKILLLILMSAAMFNCSNAFGVTLKCKFEIGRWKIVGQLYTCYVEDTGIFNGSRVTIDSIEGQHMPGKTNDDVLAIEIEKIANVNFFPANIEKHFKNLIVIQIVNSQLQEINSNELQPFPNLESFCLGGNKIKVIERDTFKYNPQLIAINLIRNEISHIDNRAFNGLRHLIRITLNGNKCKKSISGADEKSETLKIIQRIQNGDCSQYDSIIQEAIDTETDK